MKVTIEGYKIINENHPAPWRHTQEELVVTPERFANADMVTLELKGEKIIVSRRELLAVAEALRP